MPDFEAIAKHVGTALLLTGALVVSAALVGLGGDLAYVAGAVAMLLAALNVWLLVRAP